MSEQSKKAYWREKVEAWGASGLSISAFCRREGFAASTFDYWRAQFGSRRNTKSVKRAAKAKPITLIPAERETALPESIKVKSKRWELSVPASVSAEWLGALLRALQ